MDILYQTLVVVSVLGALGFGSWWLRRTGIGLPRKKSAAKILDTVERLALSPQLSVYVVRIADRQVAIAVHNSGVTVLDRIPSHGSSRIEEVLHP